MGWDKLDWQVQSIDFVQKHESPDEIIGYLQNRGRSALFFFINGSFWLEDTFSVIDIIARREKIVTDCIDEMQPYIFLLEKKYGHFINTADFLKRHNLKRSLKETANFFSIFYGDFAEAAEQFSKEGMTQINEVDILNMTTYPEEDSGYLSPLNSLKDFSEANMKDYLAGFYLHGSLATQDYIRNWSDVDTLMIIKRNAILNPDKLILLRRHAIASQKFFYQIDPFQLHGHLIISEFDIDYYPEPYFPLVLFSYAKSFWEHKPILFRMRNSVSERRSIFWNDAVHYFFSKLLTFKKKYGKCALSARDKKLFLHRLMTFPMFYLQAQGVYCYKKFSFEEAQKDFPSELWHPIVRASDMMRKWSYSYNANRNLSFMAANDMKIYFWLITNYYNIRENFAKGSLRDFDENYEKLLYMSVNLAMEGWRKIEAGIN